VAVALAVAEDATVDDDIKVVEVATDVKPAVNAGPAVCVDALVGSGDTSSLYTM